MVMRAYVRIHTYVTRLASGTQAMLRPKWWFRTSPARCTLAESRVHITRCLRDFQATAASGSTPSRPEFVSTYLNLFLSGLLQASVLGCANYTGRSVLEAPQVLHQQASDDDWLEIPGHGRCAVTVMLRTGLFPYARARNSDTTPSPMPLHQILHTEVRAGLAGATWHMPSLSRCLAMHG